MKSALVWFRRDLRDNDHAALSAALAGTPTPGMIVSSTALLKKNPNPSLDDIKAGLAGNLCRCGTYGRIFEAVDKAAKTMAAAKPGAKSPAKKGE